jgi:hypothetical protein
MKAQRGIEVYIYTFFNLALDRVINSTPRLLYPKGRQPVPILQEVGKGLGAGPDE